MMETGRKPMFIDFPSIVAEWKEGWKNSGLEGWKNSGMEGWKDGRMGVFQSSNLPVQRLPPFQSNAFQSSNAA